MKYYIQMGNIMTIHKSLLFVGRHVKSKTETNIRITMPKRVDQTHKRLGT